MKSQPGSENKPTYCTCIVPSINGYSEENNFMLSRLLPVSIRQQEKWREELEELNKQYRRYSERHAASNHQ